MEKYSFSIFGILPFFIVAFILLGLLNSKKNAKEKCLYSFVVLFIFSSIRYGIGYDYYNYQNLAMHNAPIYDLEGAEPFSRAIIDISYYTHYQVFFVLSSLIVLFLLYLSCIKMSLNPAYSMLIFFLHPLFFFNSLCIVRNAIAFSCVMYAIALLREKRLLLSFIFVISAFMFHRSGAIGLLIYPAYYLRIGRKACFILYLFSFGVSIIVGNVLGGYSGEMELLVKTGKYVNAENAEGGGTMTYIVNLLCIVNFMLWNKIVKLESGNEYWLRCYLMGTCIWNVFLSINPTIALRLSIFFTQSIIFIAPVYKYAFIKQYRPLVGRLTTSFFLMLFLSYFYINISAYLKDSSSRMSNFPYQTIFYKQDYSNYIN